VRCVGQFVKITTCFQLEKIYHRNYIFLTENRFLISIIDFKILGGTDSVASRMSVAEYIFNASSF